MNWKNKWLFRIIPVLQLIISTTNYAQDFENPRCVGLGGIQTTINDHWSVLNNPAGTAFIEKFAAGVGGQRNYFIRELDRSFFTMVQPIKDAGVLGGGYTQMGYLLYKRQQLSMNWSKHFAKQIAFGLAINYTSVHLGEGYGNKSLFKIKAGFIYKLTRDLHLAATIDNPLRAKLSEFNRERTPAIFSIGMAYSFSKKLIVNVEGVHHSNYPTVFHTGLEYFPHEKIILRGGFSGSPFIGSFGFGLIKNNLQVDVSIKHHPQLGFTPGISISFNRKKI